MMCALFEIWFSNRRWLSHTCVAVTHHSLAHYGVISCLIYVSDRRGMRAVPSWSLSLLCCMTTNYTMTDHTVQGTHDLFIVMSPNLINNLRYFAHFLPICFHPCQGMTWSVCRGLISLCLFFLGSYHQKSVQQLNYAAPQKILLLFMSIHEWCFLSERITTLFHACNMHINT